MKSSINIKVRGYHTDAFAHVNHTRYLEFMEEGRWAYMEENDLFEVFHKKKIDHVVVNININYKKPAVVGDTIRMDTYVKEAGNNKVIMGQDIFLAKTETLIADAQATNVYMDGKTGEIIPVDPFLTDIWPDRK